MARRACGRARLAADAAALGPPAPQPPPSPSDITRLVRHARRQARLSQRGLAARAGVAQSTVAEIEMGRVDPKAGTLAKLLAACNCQLAVTIAATAAPLPASPPKPAPAPHSAATDLARRLDLDPKGRVAAAGPAVVAAARRISTEAYWSQTQPIVVGDLAELIWGADRQPTAVELCLLPEDVEALLDAPARRPPTAPVPPFDGNGLPYDIQLTPAGTLGWGDLRRSAAEVRAANGSILVASLDDLIRVRRSRLSEADQALLPELEALMRVIEETERREAAGNPRFPAHWDVRPLAHLDWLLLRGRVRDVDQGRRQRTLTGFCS